MDLIKQEKSEIGYMNRNPFYHLPYHYKVLLIFGIGKPITSLVKKSILHKKRYY